MMAYYMVIIQKPGTTNHYQIQKLADTLDGALAAARADPITAKYTICGAILWNEALKLGYKPAGATYEQWNHWAKNNIKNLYTGKAVDPADLMGMPTPITPGPRKPQPVICPEVWATKRTDVDYMAAVRDMCRPTRS